MLDSKITTLYNMVFCTMRHINEEVMTGNVKKKTSKSINRIHYLHVLITWLFFKLFDLALKQYHNIM